jgi:hypothetical protein
MDPVIFDLATENILFMLDSNIPSNSVYCISIASNHVFCCDTNKKVFKYDTNNEEVYLCKTRKHVNSQHKFSDLVIEFKIFLVPSVALSSFLYDKRFLILGCMDGEIRVLDIMHTPPYPMFNFPAGNGLKSITCMQVFWETVIFRLHFQLF